MTELLPCPFCGGTRMLLSDTYDNASSAFECQNCLARGPEADTISNWHPYSRRDASEIEADARRLWNRRAPSLFGRPVIETDDLVTSPIIVGGHLLEPGETIAEVLERMERKA